MSIELERALDAMKEEGGYFRTNEDGKIIGVGPKGFKVSADLKSKLLVVGRELDDYFKQNAVAIRCFQCPHEDRCHDKTDCVHGRDGMSQGDGGAGTPPA